mmetsp:Transcript_146907/g.208263  ORF Transcript_146907/g.208263 Transcript_146907/m.208263 type:complete len:201 (+) Transcript_146907:403-1005(+)
MSIFNEQAIQHDMLLLDPFFAQVLPVKDLHALGIFCILHLLRVGAELFVTHSSNRHPGVIQLHANKGICVCFLWNKASLDSIIFPFAINNPREIIGLLQIDDQFHLVPFVFICLASGSIGFAHVFRALFHFERLALGIQALHLGCVFGLVFWSRDSSVVGHCVIPHLLLDLQSAAFLLGNAEITCFESPISNHHRVSSLL